MLNPLIALPSPRDIYMVKKYVDTITSVDKYWVKYYTELPAYEHIRTYFLYETKYDYLCILPDDCLVHIGHVSKLCTDILELNRPPVICGIANLSNDPAHKTLTSVSEYPVRPFPVSERKYMWLRDYNEQVKQGKIIKVGFAGFPLMFIRRDIVRSIPFRNDGGCCVDTMFCWDCYERDIPILCDTSVKFHHLKIGDGKYQDFYVGVRTPHTFLEPKLQV